MKQLHFKSVAMALLLLCFQQGFAQTLTAGFGDFTNDEINLSQCEFDKDADAIVLFDKARSYYNDYHNLVTERDIRLKILKERGLERGNIRIRYYSGDRFETITKIEAIALTYDDQKKAVWSKVDHKSFFDKKLNNYYSEISFAIPNLKVGTIIEYKYESTMEHYGGLREWVFQSDMPVLLSSYDLTIVPNAEFAYSVYKSKNYPITVNKNAAGGSVFFEMSNLPGLRDEAYMGAAHDYIQRVKFQFAGYKTVSGDGYGTGGSTTKKYATNWKELARDLWENRNFGVQINKDLPGADAMQSLWAKTIDPYSKMAVIHDYVRSHLTWNGIYSKFADDGLKVPWEKKTGTSAEVNLILIGLLKSAGLDVQPLLVSERDHGKVDTTYPFLDQFNKVAAYVTIAGKQYILDGTDRQTPSFMIPVDLLNTIGFIADRKNAALIHITDDIKTNASFISLYGNIRNNGMIELVSDVNHYDYARIERKAEYNRDKKKYERDFYGPYHFTGLDSFSVEGLSSDSLPLKQEVKLHYALSKTGDYYMLNYNLFTGLIKNPFTTEHRFTDIEFGCKYLYVINGSFEIPDNLVPETLPKNIKLVTPDNSMTLIRQIQQTGNTIQVGVRVQFDKTSYSADDYPDVQGFYKQMLELLNEPIVLKSKS